MTVSTLGPISPVDVHAVLARHTLADGYDLVLDFERSHGAWLHDARSGREYLDFCMFFASNPIGYNHPKMKDPEFLEVLHRVAQLKPALSDLYSVEYASFVDVFGRLAMPAHMRYAFFIEGGALGVENALKTAFDWKVRRNRAKGIPGEKGQQVIHFRAGLPRPHRLHAVAHQHRPAQDRLLPEVPLAADREPRPALPASRPRASATRRRPSSARSTRSSRPSPRNPDDIAAILIEPIQAEGGDIHFRPEFLRALEQKAREHDVLLHPRRGADRRRHHREDVGARALRPASPTRSRSARRCRCAAAWSARASTRSPRTSSRSPRASTRPGAAGSPTWCAARASSRSSTRTRCSRTRASSASGCCGASWRSSARRAASCAARAGSA